MWHAREHLYRKPAPWRNLHHGANRKQSPQSDNTANGTYSERGNRSIAGTASIPQLGNKGRRTGGGPAKLGNPGTDVVVHGQRPTGGAPRSFLAASASCHPPVDQGSRCRSCGPITSPARPKTPLDQAVNLLHITPALVQWSDDRVSRQATYNDYGVGRSRNFVLAGTVRDETQ